VFYACTFGPQLNGCLQSSVGIRSSSKRTPESVTPSAVIPQFPKCVIQIFNFVFAPPIQPENAARKNNGDIIHHTFEYSNSFFEFF